MYKFNNEQLLLKSINISYEIKRGNKLLNNKDVTIFNSSVLQLNNSNNYIIASRGWYGNIRSWDGINFIILTKLDNNFKKIDQNILDIDIDLLKNRELEFKDFKKKIIVHQKSVLEGPEDPRLFYHNNDVHILVNEIDDITKSPRMRLMYLSAIDTDKLVYKFPKTLLCKSLSSPFEKNWGPFTYNKKLYMLYDINPLKIMEVNSDYTCKLVVNKEDKIIKKIEKSFNNLQFHLRNSSNLIKLSNSNEYLGLGHAVLDYKNFTDINKYLIPAFDISKYSEKDKEYFSKFFKLYLGFFFTLDMNKKEITKLSPFFQLPSIESKQELIFFPTSMYIDTNKFVNISYSLGDNRSYLCKLHLEVVKLS